MSSPKLFYSLAPFMIFAHSKKRELRETKAGQGFVADGNRAFYLFEGGSDFLVDFL
jgi:hypothetical protein